MTDAALSRMAMSLDYSLVLDACGLDRDGWQVDFLRTRERRIALNCSRQSGKSVTAAALATCTSMFEAPALTLLVSPNQRTSGELMKKVTWFWRRLGGSLKPDQESATSITFPNKSRVVSLPGSEVSARGWSPKLVLVDEAARCDEELFFALRPTVAATQGRLVLMSTPAGRSGFFHDAWVGGGWHRVEVPANMCPRITADFLSEERASMPMWRYQAEYECAFTGDDAAVFPPDLIAQMMDGDARQLFKRPLNWGAQDDRLLRGTDGPRSAA